MERTELFEIMGELKLFGMRASYDESGYQLSIMS
jgi:hypothetical protein